MCQIDESMSIDIWNASVNRTENLPPYTTATILRRKGLLSSPKFSFELAICRASNLEQSAGFVLVGTALLSKFYVRPINFPLYGTIRVVVLQQQCTIIKSFVLRPA